MTAQGSAQLPAGSGRVILLACLAAGVVTSGIQGIAPAIPAIQAQFALTDAQIAFITSVYLFPSMLSALPAGVLADRVGVRPVLSGALALFGLGGLLLLLTDSWSALLAVRLVQGLAFGAVLALSVAVIGDIVPTGAPAARAQGRRIVVMAASEAVFPTLGGLLLFVSWSAPFVLQVLALPLAALAWVTLPRAGTARRAGARGDLGEAFRAPAALGVQVLAALRFILKYAVLTYFPVLAVNELDISPALVGAVLGLSAVLTALMAWASGRLARRWSSAQLLAGCLVVTAVSLTGMGAATGPALLIAALLLFGLQDGVYGVGHNVLVTELAPPTARSTYIGLTGTSRNVGKFVAPLLFGGLTLVLTLGHSFLALAAVSAVSTGVALRVAGVQRRITERLTGRPAGEDEAAGEGPGA